MRNQTYSMGTSLDGYTVGPDGTFDRTEPQRRGSISRRIYGGFVDP